MVAVTGSLPVVSVEGRGYCQYLVWMSIMGFCVLPYQYLPLTHPPPLQRVLFVDDILFSFSLVCSPLFSFSQLVDLTTNEPLEIWRKEGAHKGEVHHCSFSPDNSKIISCGDEGKRKVCVCVCACVCVCECV